MYASSGDLIEDIDTLSGTKSGAFVNDTVSVQLLDSHH
jgi:hypothetical protein